MTQFLLLELLLFAVNIHAVMRVWRASPLQGLLTLLVPFYIMVPLVRYWSDPDHGIRWHVLVLLVGGAYFFWSQQRIVDELIASQVAMQQAAYDDADDTDADPFDEGDDDEAVDAASSGSTPGVTIEIGAHARGEQRRRARAAPGADELPAAVPTRPVPPPPDAGPAVPEDRTAAPRRSPTLRQAVAAATFLRGRFARASAGFELDIPAHFHALSAVDARRIEAAAGQPADSREVGWIVHESIVLDDPSAWHVRVRWLDDGAAALPGPSPDPERLLRDAQAAHARDRLAGTGGALIGYAVAPTFAGDRVDWVEERLAEDGASSVLDCHALRIGSAGTLELSIVGVAAGSQSLCDATVRLLASRVRFDAAAADVARRASYTLTDLVTHLR